MAVELEQGSQVCMLIDTSSSTIPDTSKNVISDPGEKHATHERSLPREILIACIGSLLIILACRKKTRSL